MDTLDARCVDTCEGVGGGGGGGAHTHAEEEEDTQRGVDSVEDLSPARQVEGNSQNAAAVSSARLLAARLRPVQGTLALHFTFAMQQDQVCVCLCVYGFICILMCILCEIV